MRQAYLEIRANTNIESLAVHLKDTPEILKRAMSQSLRKAESVMKSYTVKATVKRFYVTSADLRRELFMERKEDSLLMRISGKRHTLRHYKLTPLRPPKNPKKRYMMKGAVKREGGLKPLGYEAYGGKAGIFLMPTAKGYKYGEAPDYLPAFSEKRVRSKRLWGTGTYVTGGVNIMMSPSYSQLIENTSIPEEAIRIATGAMRGEFTRIAIKELGVMK